MTTNYQGKPKQVDWLSIVLAHEEDYHEPEDAYVFSNGRKFKSTDKSNSGIYE